MVFMELDNFFLEAEKALNFEDFKKKDTWERMEELDKTLMEGFFEEVRTANPEDYVDYMLMTLPGERVDFYKNPDYESLQ